VTDNINNIDIKILPPDVLTKKSRDEIDAWLLKFPKDKRQSAVIAALTIAQNQNQGFLNDELITAVALYLKMPKIAVYEVATFYSLFELKPCGRYKIAICTNISCMLRDCASIVQHIKNKLGIEPGETTLDQRFTLKEVECLAACGMAPVMQIGRQYYENLTPEKIDIILDALP